MPKRIRLAVTFEPGQGSDLEEALTGLAVERKGLVRELLILGAYAKRAGFTHTLDANGQRVILSATRAAEMGDTGSVTTPISLTNTQAPAANDASTVAAKAEPTSTASMAHASTDRIKSTEADRRPVTVSAKPKTDRTGGAGVQAPPAKANSDLAEVGDKAVNATNMSEIVTVNALTDDGQKQSDEPANDPVSLEEGERLLALAFNFD